MIQIKQDQYVEEYIIIIQYQHIFKIKENLLINKKKLLKNKEY